MLVKDVMKTNTATVVVAPNLPLLDAVQKMSEYRESCLLIVEKNRVIGVLTERDMTLLFARQLKQLLPPDTPIKDLMTPEPVCISPELSCEDALTLSRSRKLRHLPVIDDQERLVGLVTQANLLDAYSRLIEKQVALESSLEELQLLSLEDPLMGIGNRRAMEVDLAFTEADAMRHDRHYAVALFDIDFFKKYNDRYGHQKGDEALVSVADAITGAIRSSDRVYRYGGEEILVLMPSSLPNSAAACCERIRSSVEAIGISHKDSHFGTLTISGGFAVASQNSSWKTVVEQADQALYHAKKGGRNQICEAPDES